MPREGVATWRGLHIMQSRRSRLIWQMRLGRLNATMRLGIRRHICWTDQQPGSHQVHHQFPIQHNYNNHNNRIGKIRLRIRRSVGLQLGRRSQKHGTMRLRIRRTGKIPIGRRILGIRRIRQRRLGSRRIGQKPIGKHGLRRGQHGPMRIRRQ